MVLLGSPRELQANGHPAFAVSLSESGLSVTDLGESVNYRQHYVAAQQMTVYQRGLPGVDNGWRSLFGNYFWFDHSPYATQGSWLYYRNHWYYPSSTAAMVVGRSRVGSAWYYVNGSGVLTS